MTQPYVMRAYQALMTEHILRTPRCALWAGMGMGKTAAVLTALDALSLTERGVALVLAPLRVAASTWPEEARKWEHLKGLRVQPVAGSAAERRAALEGAADVYTMNYENLPWLVETLGERWPFKVVVADESTRLKSFRLKGGGKRARALARMAWTRVDRFIELTGTPAPNGLADLWGQAWFLDRGQRLGRSYTAFMDRWFRVIRVGADPHAVQYLPLPHAQPQLHELLSDLCLTLDARDYFDLREPIVNVIRVELPPAARKAYRQMEKQMFLELAGGAEIEAVHAAAKTLKCLQLANGAIYNDETGATWEEVHDEKLRALDSIIEESAGAPVLVAYQFQSDLARLRKAFPRAQVLDHNPDTIARWNAGHIPILLAHPASAGHGLNLQDGGNTLVFFGHWWNLEEYQQIIERIGPTRQMQAGHDRPVFIHHIVAANTVDELVMARRETKRAVQDLLLDAMKRRSAS